MRKLRVCGHGIGKVVIRLTRPSLEPHNTLGMGNGPTNEVIWLRTR